MKFDIIITASHIPTHPSIYMIKRTIKSLRYINYQGKKRVSVYLAHDYSNKNKYLVYIENLKLYCKEYNNKLGSFKLIIVQRKSHGNLVGNIRNALKYVENEYLLIIQHDFPFCKNFKISTILQDMEENKMLKHIRFNKRSNYERACDKDPVKFWNLYNIREKNNYISTLCWSDNNHLTRKSYYENTVMKKSKDGGAMEDFLNKKKKNRSIETHYGTYIFGEIGETKYINHMDGRNTWRIKKEIATIITIAMTTIAMTTVLLFYLIF